jgi:hypothetical protein
MNLTAEKKAATALLFEESQPRDWLHPKRVFLSVEETLSRSFHPSKNNNKKKK